MSYKENKINKLKNNKILILNEAQKVDSYYTNYFSDIDKNIYNKLVKTDPKSNDTYLGLFAEKYILPAYKENTLTDLTDDNLNAITELINQYWANQKSYEGKYRNPNSFESLDNFINFMNGNLENDSTEEKIEEDPITKIYNKYYNKLNREDFNTIITLDEDTTEDKLGEVAKNLLLRLSLKDKNDLDYILKNSEIVLDAINIFKENRNNYKEEEKNLNNYVSIKDFIDKVTKIPDSNYVQSLKNCPESNNIHIIASTKNWDVVSYDNPRAGSYVGLGGWDRTDGMKWCTTSILHPSYFDNYNDYGRAKYYAFINKAHNTPGTENRRYNFQISLNPSGKIFGFLDGWDERGSLVGENLDKQLTNFLLQNIELYNALKDLPGIRNNLEVQKTINATNIKHLRNYTLNYKTLKDFIILSKEMKNLIEELSIEKLIEIDPLLFEGMLSLKKVTFKDNNLTTIGRGAFKNCNNLIKIQFPANLKIIEDFAFINSGITGNTFLPDSLNSIGKGVFLNTHGLALGVNINRKNKLNISTLNDQEVDWYKKHLKSKKM